MNHPQAIAVMTEIFHTDSHVHFGSIHEFCKELAEYSKQHHLALYVTSLSMYLENEQVGYQWINGEWTKTEVPPAKVIYNRIHSRKAECSCLFERLIHKLKDEHVLLFNRRFLHKWEVYEYLMNHPYLHPYLPKTELFTKKQLLDDFLEQFPVVFIKPIHGSQGRHIFRIKKTESEFLLDYSTFMKDMMQHYPSTSALFTVLKERIKMAAIIQQGIAIQTMEGRPVDFRLLCHRIHDSEWRVTSAVARIAQQEQFVANLARGGEIVSIDAVLHEWYERNRASQQKMLLKEIALETASVLASEADGLYGEFGIDLAIDQENKPWIIEVNTKPSKQTDTAMSNRLIRPSAKAIIDYCLSLIEQKE
jgi:glutathione synthase/RimK-type ligase-like ATP-grasp enzyme